MAKQKGFTAESEEHPNIVFKTNKGARVNLIWQKNKYRAFISKNGEWQQMFLGAMLPDSLVKHIKENY